MEQFEEIAISKLDLSDGLILKNSSLNKNVNLNINPSGELTLNEKSISTIVEGITKETIKNYSDLHIEKTSDDTIDITNPVDADLPKVTLDSLSDVDTLLVWNDSAKQWNCLTIKELKFTTAAQADQVSHSLNYDITGSLANQSLEQSFNGSKTVNIVVYQPNQEVNVNSSVKFSNVNTPIIESTSGTLSIKGNSIRIQGDNVSVEKLNGSLNTLRSNLLGNVEGNATSADRVNGNLTLAPVESITENSIRSIFNGENSVTFNIYQPNQDLNRNSNVTFTSVKALAIESEFTGDLTGNATSANRVNHEINLETLNNIIENPTSITYDGSKTASLSIYTPDQEVNKNSNVAFNTIVVADTVDTTIVNADNGYFKKDVFIENGYDLKGNATSADKVNHKFEQTKTNDVKNVTTFTKFDGSEDKEFIIYAPDQNVNTNSDVAFNDTTVRNISAEKLSIRHNDAIVGGLKVEAGKLLVEADTFTGNAASTDKVNHELVVDYGQVTIDKESGIATLSSMTSNYDGSEKKNILIKYYDDEIKRLNTEDSTNSSAIATEVDRAIDVEKSLQNQINSIHTSINGVTSFEYEIAEQLPSSGEKGKVYLVKKIDEAEDIYTEYLWINDRFEPIGVTSMELNNYLTKNEYASDKETLTEDLNDKIKDLKAEVKKRNDELDDNFAALNTSITDEADIRNTADENIRKSLQDSVEGLQAEDSRLDSRIDTEEETRKAADDELSGKIKTEELNRANADETLQSNIDNLEFIKSATAENRTLILKNRDDSKAVVLRVPKLLSAGENINITEIESSDDTVEISAVDTVYSSGNGILIDKENVISVNVDDLMADDEHSGLISAEEYKKLIGIKDIQYELQLDRQNKHKLRLVGTNYDVASEIILPDNDTTYSFKIDNYDLVVTPSDYDVNNDDNTKIQRITIPQKDTTYTVELKDHEFYLKGSDGSVVHLTLPDNDTVSGTSGNGQQVVFDICHPINEVYTQYKGLQTPAEVYNVGKIVSYWEPIIEDEEKTVWKRIPTSEVTDEN